jgi:UPF0716 family protein affecting phage T7 exclusion
MMIRGPGKAKYETEAGCVASHGSIGIVAGMKLLVPGFALRLLGSLHCTQLPI